MRLSQPKSTPPIINSVRSGITFAVNLRRDLPEPTPSITIGRFMDQVDSETAIWLEMAQKQQRQWHSQPAPKDPTPNGYGNDQRPPQRQQQWSRNCA